MADTDTQSQQDQIAQLLQSYGAVAPPVAPPAIPTSPIMAANDPASAVTANSAPVPPTLANLPKVTDAPPIAADGSPAIGLPPVHSYGQLIAARAKGGDSPIIDPATGLPQKTDGGQLMFSSVPSGPALNIPGATPAQKDLSLAPTASGDAFDPFSASNPNAASGSGIPGLPALPPFSSTATDPATAQLVADAKAKEHTKAGVDTLWERANGVQNPFLRALAHIGAVGLKGLEVAGNAVAPGVTTWIPGTELNHQFQVRAANTAANNAQAQDTKDVDTKAAEVKANVESLQPQLSEDKIQALKDQHANQLTHLNDVTAQKWAQAGFKPKLDATGQPVLDPTGQPEHEFDPESPAGKRIAMKSVMDQSVSDKNDADIELKHAEADLKKSQNDPTSPAYKLAMGRLQTAQRNSATAATRAEYYKANYLKSAYGIGLDNEALPGATQIDDGAGGLTTVGSTAAPMVNKTIAAQASFDDTHQSINNLRSAGNALFAKGETPNQITISKALQDDTTTADQWAQGLVKSTLSPEARDFVIAVKAAREGIMPLRKLVGSGVSDSQVMALQAILPNASTPDKATFDKQMERFDAQFLALKRGVPNVNRGGGRAAGGGGGGAPAPSAGGGSVRVQLRGGTVVTVPPDKMAGVLAAGGSVIK